MTTKAEKTSNKMWQDYHKHRAIYEAKRKKLRDKETKFSEKIEQELKILEKKFEEKTNKRYL